MTQPRIPLSFPHEEKYLLTLIEQNAKRHKRSRSKEIREMLKSSISLKSEKRGLIEQVKERDERIEELEKTVTWYKEHMPDSSSVEEAPKPASPQFSDIACEAMEYDKDRNPYCIDPNSPISAYARRHLTVRVCMFCQNKRNKKLKEAQKKQQEKIKHYHERKRRETHDLQQRVNETLANQKRMHNGGSGKRYFTNEYGTRIPY